MAFLEETETWEPGVYEFTDDDVIDGGPDGTDNVPTRQLANRTGWLKAQIEALSNGKQPLDETLTAIAALAIVADRLIYSTGPDTFAMTPLSAFIRTLLDDADAAAARATLGAISQAQLDAAIAALVNSSPAALDTLNELAAALGNDANFAATVNATLALKAALASPAFTGNPTAPTQGKLDSSTKLATTAWASGLGGVVGSMRNGKMSVAAASSTATFTADEVVVETALGGAHLRLANFNKNINLATVGAGGMDTGAAPVNGYVAIYAIFNPTTDTSALLAVNATAAVVPQIYGGANMPAGYTASALVSVWATNGAGQFIVGSQRDRKISRPSVVISTATPTVYTALSIGVAVPPNAVACGGGLHGISSGAGGVSINVSTDANGYGDQWCGIGGVTGLGANASFENLSILTQQTIYWITAGASAADIRITSYHF